MSDLMLRTMVALQARIEAARENEEGQGMVEYALILVFVSIAAIAILPAIGVNIVAVFTDIAAALVP